MRRSLLVFALFAMCLVTIPRELNAQQNGPHKSQREVDVAPEAQLINGNDDLDPTGNCGPELQEFCSGIEAGNGATADCLSDLIAESESPDDGEGKGTISEACQEDVYQFKIQRNTNINLNVPMAKACKVDANSFCNVTWFFGYKAGQVISCLRDVKDRLAPACKREIFKIQKDAAEDYRADPMLYEACKTDAETVCKDVKMGEGRVQACLRDKRMQLSWSCEEQLFRQEMENADDIRLSVRLFRVCMKDKKKYCMDVEPGASKVKDCLEEHRDSEGFSQECRDEVDKMLESRVRDFRLDSRLRGSCEQDIFDLCAYFGEIDSLDGDDGNVINCLQDYVGEIKDQKCKSQVLKYQELASEDIRFNSPLADACFEDRNSFCASIPPGSARVIRCLMASRSKLSPDCRAVLFDEEVRFSQNIDFQFPLKKACAVEMKQFCDGIPHGAAKVIRCLQDNKNKKEFGKGCKAEVAQYEQQASSDYRLNYRLTKECKVDIDELCSGVCNAEQGQVCGGSVLRCLTDNRAELQSESCKQEVLYFEKMEVSDYRNDVILAAACRTDVETLCADVEPGEGRVHECLRKSRSKLSEACRKEELMLEELEAENVELRPGLMKLCKDERTMFCRDVVPGGARMFRCLVEKMGDLDFGEECRGEVLAKLKRRQANWRLDPTLRKACKAAVRERCSEQDGKFQEDGAVYKCLIGTYADLDQACQKELGRALHMSFFIWEADAVLTKPCDSDIQTLCLTDRPNMAKTPGGVAQCLADIAEESSGPAIADPVSTGKAAGPLARPPRQLSAECQPLADIAEPPDMKKAFDASLSLVLLQGQLAAMEGVTGVAMLERDQAGNARSITLTGWTAISGMTAFLIIILWAVMQGYKKYKGIPSHEYTMVVKKGHSK